MASARGDEPARGAHDECEPRARADLARTALDRGAAPLAQALDQRLARPHADA